MTNTKNPTPPTGGQDRPETSIEPALRPVESAPVQKLVKVWCETCEGTGKIHQEHQAGCWVGGEYVCPDCDGDGYTELLYTAPPAQTPPVNQVMEILLRIKDAHENWGGWSGIPSNCDAAIALLQHASDLDAAPPAQTPPRLTDEGILKSVPQSLQSITDGVLIRFARAIETEVRKQWAKQLGVSDVNAES